MKSFQKFVKAILGAVKEILGFIIIYAVVIFCALLLFGFLHHELNFSFERAVITIFLGSFAVAILWTVISPIYSESRTLTDFFKNLSSSAIGLVVTIIVVGGGLWLVFKVSITVIAIVLSPILLISIPTWAIPLIIEGGFILLVIANIFCKKDKGSEHSSSIEDNIRSYSYDDEDEKELNYELECLEKKIKQKESERENIRSEIFDLEQACRNFLTGDQIPEPEREYNKKIRRELDRKIYDKKSELYDKQREISELSNKYLMKKWLKQ